MVQGVGYRYATKNMAGRLDLTGWVRNCTNGDVEGFVCGEKIKVEDFVNWLWQGPQYAKVDSVATEKATRTPCKSFKIMF